MFSCEICELYKNTFFTASETDCEVLNEMNLNYDGTLTCKGHYFPTKKIAKDRITEFMSRFVNLIHVYSEALRLH